MISSPGCPQFAISHARFRLGYCRQSLCGRSVLGRVGWGMVGILGGICGSWVYPVAAEVVPVVQPSPSTAIVAPTAIAASPDQPQSPPPLNGSELPPTLDSFNQSAPYPSASGLMTAQPITVVQFTQATQPLRVKAPVTVGLAGNGGIWGAIAAAPAPLPSVADAPSATVIPQAVLAGQMASEPASSPVQGTTEPPQMDPELGVLRLRPLPPPPVKRPVPFSFIGGMGYFSTDNSLASFDPIDDQLFRIGLAFLATPQINANTILVTAVEGNLVRYGTLADLDYDELRFQVGIRRFLTSRMYGEVGWLNQRLYSAVTGDRFLDDHAIFLGIGRQDPLAPKLKLDTFYQVRASFSDPNERSRVLNSLGLALSYDIRSDLRLSLDSQYTLITFTEQSREDFYAQFLLKLSYAISRNVSMSIFGGVGTGTSSDPLINFDSSVFGMTIDFSITPF